MNNEKEKEEKKGKQATHFVKARNVPNWSKNMKYETWKESVKNWCENHEDLDEAYRFGEVMKSLRENNSINRLSKYVNGKVAEELKDKAKRTVKEIMKALDEKYLKTKTERFQDLTKDILNFKILGGEKAEDVLEKMEKIRSNIISEKKNTNIDLFAITMMMMKAKESRLFAEGEEIELNKVIKRNADSPETILDNFKRSFREMKVEGHREDPSVKESPKEAIKRDVK